MADKRRVLVVTNEIHPYTKTEMSEQVYRYALALQESGMEVRILMPRFGNINERRHRLHEVVRLSGMNISVNDEDYPLIIKVASLPSARMQVYFLDNEEFFKRKALYSDESKGFFEDNFERTAFFCKGVVETVKKFGWAPDVVHSFGWMTSLLPAYIETHYKNEPILRGASLVYTAQNCDEANTKLGANAAEKMTTNKLGDVVEHYVKDGVLDLNSGAASLVDGATILGDFELNPSKDIPVLAVQEDFEQGYIQFYQELKEAETNSSLA